MWRKVFHIECVLIQVSVGKILFCFVIQHFIELLSFRWLDEDCNELDCLCYQMMIENEAEMNQQRHNDMMNNGHHNVQLHGVCAFDWS